MDEEWKKCILSYIDIIDVKKHAKNGNGSSIMRNLHSKTTEGFRQHLSNHDHAYVWNDSVLIVAYLKDQRGEKMKLLREVNDFKRYLDTALVMPSFAVVVEGMTFPSTGSSPGSGVDDANSSKVTVLKASSWAMANCFEIERELGGLMKDWYIDSRVTKGFTKRLRRPSRIEQVRLLPANRKRAVLMYDDYLW
jgi:hypothetical protein